MQCVQWALNNGHVSHTSTIHPSLNFSMHNCIATLRDSAMVEVSPLHITEEELFAQSKHVLERRNSSHLNEHDEMLGKFRALPPRLSSAFGRPDRVNDVLATLSAIVALVVCCKACFVSDVAGRVWQSAAVWFTKLPEHFSDMLRSEKPAALVVLAHWVMLLQRAEDCGCWYFMGMARRMMDEIGDRLGVEDQVLRHLVQELISDRRCTQEM
jgi:hypothetical protein